MRFGDRRDLVAAAVVAVLVLSAIPPVYAAIPVVRTEVGGKGGFGVSQPFEEGYTDLTATSSNSDVVVVSQVETPTGRVVSFESKSPGIAIVSVAWRNPTLNRVIQGFFVVASGVIVDSADTMTLTNDQTMLISAPTALRANAYVGTTVFPSNAVVAAAYIQSVGVQLTAQSVGTSFVGIELPRDSAGIQHFRVMIVSVVPSGQPAVY